MNIKSIPLGKRIINEMSKPYVIAEIGVNHEGSIKTAKKLIELAKEGGADAAKFQTYKATSLASRNSPAYWDQSKEATDSQFSLFKKYDGFERQDYVELAEHCKKVEIDFISTPFDNDAIETLDPLVPFFKIASADVTNIPFLRNIGAKKKTVVLSTGASNITEVQNAINTLEKAGCENLILLHCILNYPTQDNLAHIRMIKGLKAEFPGYLIGYSDHTLPNDNMSALISAWLLGAVVIEKHFTHDKSLKGNDHYHAMDVKDLKSFTRQVEKIDRLLGLKEKKEPISSENISRENARRSIVLANSVPAGYKIKESDLTQKRPGTGICPSNWDDVIGTRTLRNLKEDHILLWKDIEKRK